ncbi:hypothetical protein PINS_up016551 [Pythium insidiosum]|nr:hypothetical protein PINS_up016551 [Pythium insidiosum]
MWDGGWSELLLKQLLGSTPLVVSDYLDRFAVVLNHDETKIQFSSLKCMYGTPETPVDSTLLATLSRHQHARRLVTHRAVQYIIKTKWSAFGANRFRREFAIFILLLLSFYIPTVAADYRPLNVDSPVDIVLTASRAIAVASALFLLLSVELAECIGATPRKYLSSFWNWVNLVSYVGVLASAAVDAIKDLEPARNGVIAVLHVALWINLLQFLQVSSTSGLLVAMMRHMVKDVYKFLLLYAVFLFGYSGAFYVLLRGSAGYDSFINAFITVFLMLFGALDYSVFSDKNENLSTWSWFVANALLLSHLVAVVVMLLNILIAMMTTTFEDVWDAAEAEALLIRARAIVRIEKTLTHHEREAPWRNLLSSSDLREWETTVVDKALQQREQQAVFSRVMHGLKMALSTVAASLIRVGEWVTHLSCRCFRRQRKPMLRRVMDLFAAKRMAPLEDGVRFEESLGRSSRSDDLAVETNESVKELQAQVAELTRVMIEMQRQLKAQN